MNYIWANVFGGSPGLDLVSLWFPEQLRKSKGDLINGSLRILEYHWIFCGWRLLFEQDQEVKCSNIKYSDYLCLNRAEVPSNCNPAEGMVYPIGTVLFQLFRSYHSRMNKCSLLDNHHGILILFHFHDVTQRLYDQCGDRKYSDHLCLSRTEIQSNCNPDNQSGRNDISDWYSFISAISLIL